jgi:hypothetical protein
VVAGQAGLRENRAGARRRVFAQGPTPRPAYRKLDDYIAQTEQYHQFNMPKRVTVIATADWGDFRRFAPGLGPGVGGVTITTGTAIYIRPRSRRRIWTRASFYCMSFRTPACTSTRPFGTARK